MKGCQTGSHALCSEHLRFSSLSNELGESEGQRFLRCVEMLDEGKVSEPPAASIVRYEHTSLCQNPHLTLSNSCLSNTIRTT